MKPDAENPQAPQILKAHRRFEELSAKHSERLRKLVRLKIEGVLRQRTDTDEVMQEVMCKGYQLFLERNLSTMQDREFLPWITEVAKNKIKDLARHHDADRRTPRREANIDSSGASSRLPAAEKTPSAILADRESFEEMQEAIAKLSPREREVINLVHFQGLKVGRAAEVMGKTPNATSVLLHKALEKLEQILERRRH